MTLVDSLPREVRLVSATVPGGSCTTNPTRDTVTCTFFGLDAGHSAIATIAVTPRRGHDHEHRLGDLRRGGGFHA